jgi:hypothetical protein
LHCWDGFPPRQCISNLWPGAGNLRDGTIRSMPGAEAMFMHKRWICCLTPSPSPQQLDRALYGLLYLWTNLSGREHWWVREGDLTVWVLELFNSSKTMTRRGRHVQRGLVSSSIANCLPPPESQLHTHTQHGSPAPRALLKGNGERRGAKRQRHS